MKKSYPGTSLIRSRHRPRIFGKSATSSSASARKRSSSTISSGRCRATWCLSPRPKTTMSMPISLSTMCAASIKIISNHHRPQQGKYNNRFYKKYEGTKSSKANKIISYWHLRRFWSPLRGITPHSYLSWKCYANSFHYSYARTQTHSEEIKEDVACIHGHDLVL